MWNGVLLGYDHLYRLSRAACFCAIVKRDVNYLACSRVCFRGKKTIYTCMQVTSLFSMSRSGRHIKPHEDFKLPY